MTRQVVEYTDLIELFLFLFFSLCLVFFPFLFNFFKKCNEKVEFLDKKSFKYNENLLAGINILIEQNNNSLIAINNVSERIEVSQKLALDLKAEIDIMQEYLILINKTNSKNSEELVKEFINLIHIEKENIKLLNIINRKIHNKPKIDNVQ